MRYLYVFSSAWGPAAGILLLTTKDTKGTKRKTTAKGAKDAKDGKRVF
jgi:hypothetical protein